MSGWTRYASAPHGVGSDEGVARKHRAALRADERVKRVGADGGEVVRVGDRERYPRLFKDRTDQTGRSDFQIAPAQTIGLYRSRCFSMVSACVVALIYEDRIGWQRFF